jgi:His/Glu/Gln/Arg/opine family amino acid ABC transporter permease subunit
MTYHTASASPQINSAQARYMRTRPGWSFVVRRYEFIALTLALLVLYAAFLLPATGSSPALRTPSLVVFIVLVLAWTANILVDGDKPAWLQGMVAAGLVAVLAWLFYRYSGTKWDRLGNAFFNLSKMRGSWGQLWQGLLVTLELAFLAALFAVLVGLVVAILRWLNSPTLNLFLIAYIDIFRSVPMVVLMVVVFYALPYVGITLASVTATIVALALGYGAYAAEAFRAGIESVHFGQTEAARALGLTRLQTMRLVILPQAIRVVIPPLTGVLVAMLKDTAVASVVASPELLKRAREVYVGKGNPTALVMAALIYLAILLPLARFSSYLERRSRRGVRHS